ncbi:MAG: VOC family protein [Bacteroidales bacterium]|nr:VOC family protein [Bacteroidales bacterium]
MQQVGVGTTDFRKSWDWYIKTFGFDIKILEDDTVAERMLPYTGGKAQKRHACIAVNLQGGGGLEIWQYSERTPLPAGFGISVGDTGIFAAKIKCRDVEKFHAAISSEYGGCSPVSKDPAGTPCFYVADPFGNTFQIIEKKDVFIGDRKLCGGIAGAFIGVRDMQRSKKFYREVLGYDKMFYDDTGVFSDWSLMPGAGGKCRRVLLGKSGNPEGAFSGLLGTNTIELVQPLERTPAKIYEGRFWGDPGFIQICYDISGMDDLKKFCASKGHPFTVDSCPDGERFDMGEASGRFSYIEDPDGTLIEFVETGKVPVIGKLGLYIDMKKRKQNKRLPKFLFRMMGLVSRQK